MKQEMGLLCFFASLITIIGNLSISKWKFCFPETVFLYFASFMDGFFYGASIDFLAVLFRYSYMPCEFYNVALH
uniref:Uncharacterized protein n=1 Tax=Caenorhabditis japonica TaxID=281687 RepID=A0A8R1I6R2_CAEJA